jgi:trehalose-6-phosphate hydrolase
MKTKLLILLLLSSALFISNIVEAQNKTVAQNWWKEAVFYQIYMPSYTDSDGNGYGDFIGMTQNLAYSFSYFAKGGQRL